MSIFRFKQFEVAQDKCAMKIGTDGVLLGAWVESSPYKNILDIGTGTGVISLMLAQRFSESNILAIEMDKQATTQARENFKNSSWKNRLSVENTSLQKFKSNRKFDLIISNPPFFENSFLPSEKNRQNARHTNSLPFEDLIERSENFLSENGKFAVIIPFQYYEKLIDMAATNNLFPERICHVKGNKNKPLKRTLLFFSRKKIVAITTSLTIEIERHIYTPEYIALVKDFYLKM